MRQSSRALASAPVRQLGEVARGRRAGRLGLQVAELAEPAAAAQQLQQEDDDDAGDAEAATADGDAAGAAAAALVADFRRVELRVIAKRHCSASRFDALPLPSA